MSTGDTSHRLLAMSVAAFNRHDVDAYAAFYAEDCRYHDLPRSFPPGREGIHRFYGQFMAAFPDLQITVLDAVAEGGRLMAHYAISGTHLAPYAGIAPTGRKISARGATLIYVADGLVTERWTFFDQRALIAQLRGDGP